MGTEILNIYRELVKQNSDYDDGFLVIDYIKVARDFLDGFDDEWCVVFFDALKEECERKILEHWKEFAPKNMERYIEDWIKKLKVLKRNISKLYG
ncbi:MAG: hypothetical protein ACOC80_09820 [Petrotogales bacterium]